jgi:enoyl-CoA hydratase
MMLAGVANEMGKDVGRNARLLRRKILNLQASFNAVDNCRKPVLAAIQGYCLGGAIDLIAACDMRYAAEDAQFSIKEIDIGMAADVGTLQRLPRIIGDGMLRELAYTGRTFGAEEARAWAWSIAFTATRPACLMASWALPARSPASRRLPSPAPRK